MDTLVEGAGRIQAHGGNGEGGARVEERDRGPPGGTLLQPCQQDREALGVPQQPGGSPVGDEVPPWRSPQPMQPSPRPPHRRDTPARPAPPGPRHHRGQCGDERGTARVAMSDMRELVRDHGAELRLTELLERGARQDEAARPGSRTEGERVRLLPPHHVEIGTGNPRGDAEVGHPLMQPRRLLEVEPARTVEPEHEGVDARVEPPREPRQRGQQRHRVEPFHGECQPGERGRERSNGGQSPHGPAPSWQWGCGSARPRAVTGKRADGGRACGSAVGAVYKEGRGLDEHLSPGSREPAPTRGSGDGGGTRGSVRAT